LRSSRNANTQRAMRLAVIFLMAALAGAARAAAPWMLEDLANLEQGTVLEAVFYRMMDTPGGAVAFRRPAKETRSSLSELIQKTPGDANLLMLRAMEDERQLDFSAAETDWKAYAEKSQDKAEAQSNLADFYERRMRPADELKALESVGQSASPAAEALMAPSRQREWAAFERALEVIKKQALGDEATKRIYREWMNRYPTEASLEARFFEYLLGNKDYAGAEAEVASYAKKFPRDAVFPVKSAALLNYRKGSIDEGLAVYERSFQPLWPPELVQSYFQLMKTTHRERQFLDRARAALNANPDDLNALTRVFFYYQQQGKTDVAQQTVNEYRLSREDRKSQWKSEEVYTLARLMEQIHAYPESARYYYALYNTKDAADAQERALAGMTDLLLTAPEQPIRLGSGELSMYKDIGTMDQGPGYFNGILSLWLNTIAIQGNVYEEEQKAVPYFHRACASALLSKFDAAYPRSERRAELHAKLIEVYSNYGDAQSVIKFGQEFLRDFPASPARTTVGFQMADAYARTKQMPEEFAIYDSLLKELAEKAQHVPLGESASNPASAAQPNQKTDVVEADGEEPNEGDGEGADAASSRADGRSAARKQAQERAFSVAGQPTAQQNEGVRSPEYQRVLDRYLSRLVSLKKLPQALTVLRGELDRNPNDPGIYERLAQFLDENQLWADQEQVYRRAIQQFPDKSWYHKLARWYLRRRRDADFDQLTQQVVKIFRGSALENYFRDVVQPYNAEHMYLRLNQYAHQRFPHNLTFVRNLISVYRMKVTYDPAAVEALLQQYWFEDAGLKNQYFEMLSSRGQLDAALEKIKTIEPSARNANWTEAAAKNPAAVRFYATGKAWMAHYEESAPALGALSDQDPSDLTITTDTSAVFRSLAYFDPKNTDRAVQIEQNKLKLDPGNRDTMARIGDIYADRALFEKASPYWLKMPLTEPGSANSYLEPATVFWDYYRFDEALALLEQGRQKLNDSSLYAYQAGAIYENKRDYAKAVDEYLKGALTKNSGGEAQGRLLQLAKRKGTRELVDSATEKTIAVAQPTMEAIQLRMAVLDAQSRKDDLAKFLMSQVSRTQQSEVLEDLESMAEQRSLEDVRQFAIERQANLTHDPVRRLELRYALARFYEAKKDTEGAQRNVEALYKENAKILGVVRATVDFYWRTKQPQKAIDVLLQAAKDSYDDSAQPGLRTRFTFEAARKLTDAGDYPRAKELLAKLLTRSPQDGEFLAAMADVYARAGDDKGLRDFYMAKIEEFKKLQLPSARIAELRRGLIPALTRLKDYAGAVDQYIEIINKYPEDEALTTEASFYALRWSQQEKLTSFYSKTVATSPKDSRWAVVLGRVETSLENYPAAIDAYSKAIVIRPDRVDLRTSRATLNERLLKFDDAIADYEKLYELSYHNASWMEKVAETRARQGQVDATVKALRIALIDGHPEGPAKYFEVARRLEGWNMLAQARDYCDQGMKAAGNDLLVGTENQSGARMFARLSTRMRKHDVAYVRLLQAERAANLAPASAGAQEKTEAQFKGREMSMRRQSAHAGLTAALKEIGTTVNRYYTPEERLQFREFLASKRAGMTTPQVLDLLFPMAENVDTALEVRYRLEAMMAAWKGDSRSYEPQNPANASVFSSIQRKRMKFDELGRELEAYDATLPPTQRGSALRDAAQSYRSAGDAQNELRVLQRVNGRTSGDDRYLELMLAMKPTDLVAMASNGQSAWRDRVADYVVSHGDAKLAQAAIQARAAGLDPVWRKSYTGLTGLYFKDPSTDVNGAFLGALGDETIGTRVTGKVDRQQQLAGNVWFYYGSRYGEYRSVMKTGDAEDFLPANIEMAPARAAGYSTLAEYYAENGKTQEALVDFSHVLELSPERADIHDRIAVLLWTQGKRDDAIVEWKFAFDGLARQLAIRKVPGSFWTTYRNTVTHISSRKLVPQFRGAMDTLLKAYVKSNGTWQVQDLLRVSFESLHDSAAGVEWMLELSKLAPAQASFLGLIARSTWIPQMDREPVYRRLLELAQQELQGKQGLERDYATNRVVTEELEYTEYLIKLNALDRAQATLDSISADNKQMHLAEIVPVQLLIAAKTKTLDPILENYKRDAEHAPPLPTLQDAAKRIQESGDKQSARKILEYVFARQIDEHQLTAPTFLGLAEIRLDAEDNAGAMELLRRMCLTMGGGFENLDSSAALLMKHNRPTEALEFLQQLTRAVPWSPEFQVRMAEAQIKAGKDAEHARETLVKVASDGDVAYASRVMASKALVGSKVTADLHSGELKLLAAGAADAADVAHPFYYDARLLAAETASAGDKIQILRSSLEDWPERQPARVELLKASVDARQYLVGLGAVEPILQGMMLETRTEPSAMDDGEDSNAENQDWNAQYSLGSLPQNERALLAAKIGEAFDGDNRSEQALRYFRVAYKLEKSAEKKKALQARVTQLRAELNRKTANEARRPVIHPALEQDRVVRPRLLAKAPPSGAKPAQAEGRTR
jgi:cellulose synthase operon protein C